MRSFEIAGGSRTTAGIFERQCGIFSVAAADIAPGIRP
jgi:hypothetical protein